MSKRGQVTIFVILGIVILFIVILGYSFRTSIFKTSSETAIKETASFADEVNGVRAQVEDCMESALSEAIPWFGNTPFKSYDEYYTAVGSFVSDRMKACLNVAQFRGLSIDKQNDPVVTVFADNQKTMITAIAKFDLKITKAESEQTLSEFQAKINLKNPVYGSAQ